MQASTRQAAGSSDRDQTKRQLPPPCRHDQLDESIVHDPWLDGLVEWMVDAEP
jgi:hypothetical protein